jgi:macrolide-specific efflux system membrane fusion protein
MSKGPLGRLPNGRWRLLLIALLVLVPAGLALAWLQPALPGLNQAERRVAQVRRDTVRATIRTIGRVQSARSLAVGSPLTAAVTLVAVRLGDRVERGDILAELDSANADRDLTRARANLEQAELRLTAAQVNANRAEAGVAELNTLYAAGQDAQNARNALAQAEEAKRATLIVAPMAGTVVSVGIRERQGYSGGSEAFVLNDLSSLSISGEVDEVDLAAVLRTQGVRVTLDAYPGRELPARLASVAPTAQQRQGSTIYPATVEFERPPDLDIRPGMSANIAFVTASKPEALTVPAAAIRRIGERRYVQVVRAGGTEQVEVMVGLEGDGQIEIVSGLSEGDVVVLP